MRNVCRIHYKAISQEAILIVLDREGINVEERIIGTLKIDIYP